MLYIYIVFRLEPPSSGNSSLLNARNSTAHSTGHKIIANHVLLESSNASDSLQVPHSKDNKMSTISQLTGARIAKLGIRSPMSDRVPEKEQNSLQAHQRSKEKQPSGPSKKQRSALEKLQGATRSFTSPVPYLLFDGLLREIQSHEEQVAVSLPGFCVMHALERHWHAAIEGWRQMVSLLHSSITPGQCWLTH